MLNENESHGVQEPTEACLETGSQCFQQVEGMDFERKCMRTAASGLFETLYSVEDRKQNSETRYEAMRLQNGCLVRVFTRHHHSIAESLTYVPNVKLAEAGGGRLQLVAMTREDYEAVDDEGILI